MSSKDLHPATVAMLETQAVFDQAYVASGDPRRPSAIPPAPGSPLEAAGVAAGEAALAWVRAGGPDRDSADPLVRAVLTDLWSRSLASPSVHRALARRGGGHA